MVALADSAQQLVPMTVGLLPGQDVLTVPSMALKIAAQVRGLGCGYLPEPLIRAELASGRLIEKARILLGGQPCCPMPGAWVVGSPARRNSGGWSVWPVIAHVRHSSMRANAC